MRAASLWERDLLALTLRSFTSEFPTPGAPLSPCCPPPLPPCCPPPQVHPHLHPPPPFPDMPTTPLILEPVGVELVDADDLDAAKV